MSGRNCRLNGVKILSLQEASDGKTVGFAPEKMLKQLQRLR
ncbi:hypothetical protein [Adhaeribacter terrigena]|nr:hypothetical protein [Adhaeribacter terrigena]